MGFEITVFSATRIKAEANHGGASHWVDITVFEPQRNQPPHQSVMTIHFDGADAKDKADAYAASINFVDLRFHTAERMKELADA